MADDQVQDAKTAWSGMASWVTNLFSWKLIRDLAVIALLAVAAFKLARADVHIKIDSFSFSELLALLLALFSVWLSALFYFKADEGSNRFYNNSYRFTKEMGGLLGRIEERFGERLRHLDEGYAALRDTLSAQAAKEAVVVDEKEAEVSEIVDKLTTVQQGDEVEQAKLLEDLKRTRAELSAARDELASIQAQATAASEAIRKETPSALSPMLIRIRGRVAMDKAVDALRRYESRALEDLTGDELRAAFARNSARIGFSKLHDMQRAGLVDGLVLTDEGMKVMLKSIERPPKE